jgi:protoporphyrinogen/coproporphyrinogen III oxidase
MVLLSNRVQIQAFFRIPKQLELIENLHGDCELEIADEAAKARWIWKAGKWEPLPSGLIKGITTPLFTFSDKLRLLGEPFRKKGTIRMKR